jgi:hypothetical protein
VSSKTTVSNRPAPCSGRIVFGALLNAMTMAPS